MAVIPQKTQGCGKMLKLVEKTGRHFSSAFWNWLATSAPAVLGPGWRFCETPSSTAGSWLWPHHWWLLNLPSAGHAALTYSQAAPSSCVGGAQCHGTGCILQSSFFNNFLSVLVQLSSCWSCQSSSDVATPLSRDLLYLFSVNNSTFFS